ncbi:NAD-dependent epimerase/dehydratase family protein [Parapedobacter sp. 10938]|uniref:NAD-dependent epimerase/dehydratase family protein n=1 Tax=Parapedobacter flavus TaxID=3110225 RepID=UPI002DBC336C|nr:NAD-dependent epimerase/dehydratase family protein [Parapedobacter sp. 10938]MEC3880172.1 NAD-dependent epimerase/dehydratase family protein [Parapedobacter sp. 10938]
MNVVITGASGFVGQNLQPFLEEDGFEISPLSLRHNSQHEVSDHYDAIIHLAGKAHDTKNISAPDQYFRVNTELTKQLFDRFLQSDARDFIYFSSVKAVADQVAGHLVEDVEPNPQTPYGQSKRQAEQYLNSQSLPAGKRLFILRPCMIHGPGNKGNLNLLYQVVSKGLPWPLTAFDNERSFLSIDNLNYIIKRILEDADIPGGTYNLADDDPLSTNELIGLIGQAREKKPSLWKIPRGIVSGIAKIGDTLHLPLNSERLKKLTESYVVRNSKIKSALKIDKLPVSAREGLLKTLRSF